MAISEVEPFNMDAAIAGIPDPLQRLIAEELRILGYRRMLEVSELIAAQVSMTFGVERST